MNARKVQDFVVKGKEIFEELEDSKKTWTVRLLLASFRGFNRQAFFSKYHLP
jgi:hypothetical protein